MPYACETLDCSEKGKPKLAGKCHKCKKPRILLVATTTLVGPSNLDIRGDRIEPDAIGDANKLCIYKALAKAQFTDPSGTWKKIVEETKPLRDEFRVSFDEDAWSPALADFYRFATVATKIAYQEVLPKCKAHHDKIKKGQALPFVSQYFVLTLANEETSVIGHAILIEYTESKSTGTTLKVIDNENASQTDKIASRFQPALFNVFGRSEDDAAKSRADKFDAKKGHIKPAKVTELTRLVTEKV